MTWTIVVPCFNEAARWDAVYWKELGRALDVRWLFVDDGSTDDTGALIGEVCRVIPADAMTMPRNSGKAEAVRAGMVTALGGSDVVGYLDADGAFPVEAVVQVIGAMQERCEGASVDAVWSSRVALAGRSIDRRTSRHYVGRAVITLASIGRAGVPYDTQSGLKLFRTSPVLREALAGPFRTRWLFEFELLDRWMEANGRPMRIWEEPVCAWRDVSGSHLRGRQIPRIARELATTFARPWHRRKAGGCGSEGT